MSYEQTIYNLLTAAGISQAGALGILGNWWCESNCEPYRVQGDFSPYRTVSKDYVARLENFQMTCDQFAYDQKGFGLPQWTYFSRKINLYNWWRNSSLRIDSCELQVSFALHELETEYSGLLSFLKTANDVFLACSRVCREYERPAVNNIDARYSAAMKIKSEIDLSGGTDGDDEPQDDTEPTTKYWPPKRQICQGMSGSDVSVLKAILNALEIYRYDQGEDVDIFGQSLREAVIAYQKQAFPNQSSEWDGIVGNKTWGKLLERGG